MPIVETAPIPLFLVAPEIVDLFGGEAATRRLLAELYGTYPCAVYGKPAASTPTTRPPWW
jgi:hypothetical protein